MPAAPDVLLVRRGDGEAGSDQEDRLIGQARHGFHRPQRLLAGPAVGGGGDPHERIDHLVAAAHIEMEVREAGIARQSDQRQRLARLDGITLLDHQAGAAEMTVPGGPTAVVSQANAVAALLARDRLPTALVDAHVGHAIAQRVDHARRRRPHLDARRHRRQVTNCDVGTVVTVAGAAQAHVIANVGAGVVIDVAQHPAIGAGPAIHRKDQTMGWLGGRRHRDEQRHEEGGGSSHGGALGQYAAFATDDRQSMRFLRRARGQVGMIRLAAAISRWRPATSATSTTARRSLDFVFPLKSTTEAIPACLVRTGTGSAARSDWFDTNGISRSDRGLVA